MQQFKDLAREEIRDLPIYVPGKPIDEVKRELDLTEVIKLASNENPWGPSPLALEAMHNALVEIHRYPDANAYDLKNALAESFGLTREHFLFGNGSEEIVRMIAEAFFRPGEEVLMGVPTFPLYETSARILGAIPVEIPLKDGYYPLEGMLEKISPKTRAIYICNPNNPSGTELTEEEIREFVAKVPEHIILIFDEAYFEFSKSRFSATALLDENRPILIMRTFSKAFGLAGIRIGFVIGQPELLNALNQVRDPFNVNSVAFAGALAAWKDEVYLAEIISKNAEERQYITESLEGLGAKVWPSGTNFVMAFIDYAGENLTFDLLRKGIIVRPGKAYGYPGALRISVGTREENAKMLKALAELLGK